MAAPTVPMSRIDEYFASIPDPFPTLNHLLNEYAPQAVLTPAECWAKTESSDYVQVFLACYRSSPHVITFPFTSSSAGQAPTKSILWGNVTGDGQIPEIVPLTSEAFRLTPNHSVLLQTVTTLEWNNNPNANLLPSVPGAHANHMELRCRKIVPVPHEFVARMLRQQDAGNLSWRWIWTSLVEGSILGDHNKEAAYQYFLEYIRVSSFGTAAAVAGQADGPPPTDYNWGFGPTIPKIKSLALQRLRSFLPGLGTPSHLSAQLMQIQNNQAVQQAAFVAAQAAASAPATIQGKTPIVFQVLCNICEVTSEAQLPAFYPSILDMKTAYWLTNADQFLAAVCTANNIPRPTISQVYVSEIGRGMFTGVDMNYMAKGFSIFRLRVPSNPKTQDALRRNEAYLLLASGGGSVQGADAKVMILADNEVAPPREQTEFQEYLLGQYAMLATFIGMHSRATIAYRDHIYSQVLDIVRYVNNGYTDPRLIKEVWIKIMVFITRETDRYFTQLLHAPAAGGAAAVVPPRYHEIMEHLQQGRIRTITDLPPGMFELQNGNQNRGGNDTPSDQGNPGQQPSGNTGAGSGGGGGGRGRDDHVTLPNQNINLKRAWAATGREGIFKEGSPFHDPTARNNRLIMPADPPDTRRICLPMALTGRCFRSCTGKHEPLSDAEVQRVAAKGNLQL